MSKLTDDEKLQSTLAIIFKLCGEHEARARIVYKQYEAAGVPSKFVHCISRFNTAGMVKRGLDVLEEALKDSYDKKTGELSELTLGITLFQNLP